MNCCIYLRKSRADKEAEKINEGETLLRHEKLLLNFAKKQNLKIVKIYKEIVSGELISARPQMQLLLSDVAENKFDAVLVTEIERLARGDTKDQGTVAEIFKYSNTKIITPTKVYDPNNEFDEEFFEFGLFMSRREYKTINRRIQQGRLASVQEGKFISSTPPFGYIKIKIKNGKGYTLEPDTINAEAVKTIFDLYTKGEIDATGKNKPIGIYSIAKKMNLTNYKPPRSENWSPSTIKDILSNPVYIGKICWSKRKETKKYINGKIFKKRLKNTNYIIADGLHKPIIDKSTFDKAQNIMKSKYIPPVASNKDLKNQFSGIIFCKKCGKPLTRIRSSKREDFFRLKCPNPMCDNISTDITAIENVIIHFLDIWLKNYKFNLKNKVSETENAIQNEIKRENIFAEKKINSKLSLLKKEIEVTKKQAEKLCDLLEQGIYTPKKFAEREKVLNQKLQKLNKEKLETEKKQKEIKKIPISSTEIKKILFDISENETISNIYKSLKTAQQKNEILKNIIEKIEYSKSKKAKKNSRNSAEFNLYIYPKLPKK